jgi:thiol-disulfide isomerase/thioredoxin
VPNKEFIQQGSEGEDGDSGLGKLADIYFIHAPWCPYSKKVKPTWDQIKEEYDGKNINNYTLKFFDINGEKEEKKLKEFEKTYNKQIDGYPTICIVKDNQVIEFEAKPDKNTLEEFINTVL